MANNAGNVSISWRHHDNHSPLKANQCRKNGEVIILCHLLSLNMPYMYGKVTKSVECIHKLNLKLQIFLIIEGIGKRKIGLCIKINKRQNDNWKKKMKLTTVFPREMCFQHSRHVRKCVRYAQTINQKIRTTRPRVFVVYSPFDFSLFDNGIRSVVSYRE